VRTPTIVMAGADDLLIDLGEAERVLLVVRECLVYKLPPRQSASGHRCQDWPKENWLFTGRLRVLAEGDKCKILIEDQNTGELFAQCPLNNEHPESSVEPVADSSRYFVIRVDDGQGRHAYLGMGFRERAEAFDFNVALQDHVKQVRAGGMSAQQSAQTQQDTMPPPPAHDYSLKAGEKITVSIGGRTPAPRSTRSDVPSASGGALAPPPALGAPPGGPPVGGGRRRPVPGQAGSAAGSGGAAGQDAGSTAADGGWVSFG